MDGEGSMVAFEDARCIRERTVTLNFVTGLYG